MDEGEEERVMRKNERTTDTCALTRASSAVVDVYESLFPIRYVCVSYPSGVKKACLSAEPKQVSFDFDRETGPNFMLVPIYTVPSRTAHTH